MTGVREATKSDVPSIAPALGRAFADDPIMQYLLPREQKRPKQMRTFFTHDSNRALEKGAVYTTDTDEAQGGAVWSAPGKWKVGGFELIGQLPMVAAFGRNVGRALSLLGRMEKAHPTEPHWYLAILGTDPSYQGKGIGSALMQPILDRCDAEGLGAYLESSKESNILFYRRHGFDVTGEITTEGGPSLWPMWRDPR
jgi:ribosomal protein S18 acetylase RimI-like enzyme